jgi:hypothetical protein
MGHVPAPQIRRYERPSLSGLEGSLRAQMRRSAHSLVSPFKTVTGGNGSVGLGQDGILSRITHRHFAILRSRSKPNSSNRSVGPVWK